jgi:hypothetical protein
MTGLYDAATVGAVVTAAMRRFPDRVAFRQDGIELTYRQVECALARWLSAASAGCNPLRGSGCSHPIAPRPGGADRAGAAGGRYTALCTRLAPSPTTSTSATRPSSGSRW